MVEGSGDYEASKPENVDIFLGVLMFRKSSTLNPDVLTVNCFPGS